MKVYLVMHQYGVDGGYGEYISEDQVIGVFSTEEKAQEIVDKFGDPHVYDTSYANLDCGFLYVKEMELDPEIKSIKYTDSGYAVINEEETE